MYRTISAFGLCLALCLLATRLHAATPSDTPEPQNTLALQLAQQLGIQATVLPVMRGLLPHGNAQALLDLLLERDKELWQSFDHQVADSLSRSLNERQMRQMLEFFESPLGQDWLRVQPALAEQALAPQPDQVAMALPPISPALQRLAKALNIEEDSTKVLLGQSLKKRQLKKLAEFFEGSLGQTWVRANASAERQLLKSFDQPSAIRRLSVVGCTLGIMAPNLEAALQSTGTQNTTVTASMLEPLLPRIDVIHGVCDCLMGRVVKTLGFDALLRYQQGDPNVASAVNRIIQESNCIPAEILDAAEISVTRKTVHAMSQVGLGMMQWLTDRVTGDNGSEPAREAHAGWSIHAEDDGATVPFIEVSSSELERLLVPTYLQELPKVDGWGNTFQFAINWNLLDAQTMSIRSAGPDGIFEDRPYEIQSFSTEDGEFGDDLVWADGYFVLRPPAP